MLINKGKCCVLHLANHNPMKHRGSGKSGRKTGKGPVGAD